MIPTIRSIGDGGPRWVARMQDRFGNSVDVALSGFGAPLEEERQEQEGIDRQGLIAIRWAICEAIIAGRPISFTWEMNGVKYPGMQVQELRYEY